MPPRSGLKVIALRLATLRVRGVHVSKNACSHRLATSMEKFQEVSVSERGALPPPPSSPVAH